MKRWIQITLIGVLAAVAAGARAQDKGKPGKMDRMEQHKARMAEHMGLSKEQADKFDGVFKAERKAMKPLERDLRDAMIKLQDQVEDEAGDDAIQGSLDRVRKAKNAIAAEHDRFQDKLGDILPATQRAKMLLAHGGPRPPMGPMGMGPQGPGMMGPGPMMPPMGGPGPMGMGPMGMGQPGMKGGQCCGMRMHQCGPGMQMRHHGGPAPEPLGDDEDDEPLGDDK